MQPFCVTALGNRLRKRYVTACLVTYPVMQPLMEMVCNYSVYSLSTICLALAYTIYGSGR
jgi:hypothetical protein